MKNAAAPVGQQWLWTLAFCPPADARLRADARGSDGGVREELAEGIGRVSLTRRSQQVRRLRCGYVTATHLYAYFTVVQKMALTAIVAQAHYLN
jgi:hypothetical protein